MFKTGDIVKKLDGSSFSNGALKVTVNHVEGDKVWFKETASYLHKDYVVKVLNPNVVIMVKELEDQLQVTQDKIREMKSEEAKLQTAIEVLKSL